VAVTLVLAVIVRAVGDTSDSAAQETTDATDTTDTTDATLAPTTIADAPADTDVPPAPASVSVTDPSSAPTTDSIAPSADAGSSTAEASAATWSEDFATAAGLDRLEFQLHTSNVGDTNTKISATFMGEHDEGCHGPDTHRVVQGGNGSKTFVDVSDSDLIWWCAPTGDSTSGHFMTALDTTDVATLSFSPRQTFTDVSRVCWEQNMNNLGEGKWLNMFVVPASDVADHGGDLNYAAATGLAFGGNDLLVPPGGFNFTWLRGSTMAFSGYDQTMDFWKSVEPGGMDPSPAPRYRICVQSGGDMVIERPDGTTDRMAIGTTFPTGEVKVIFQDGSYNPVKHNGSADHLTWHWDNIAIETT
jgi:hypothetical protein